MTHTCSIPVVTLVAVYEMVRETTAQSTTEDWAVRKYLESVSLNKPPTLAATAARVLRMTAERIRKHNAKAPPEKQIAIPEELSSRQISDIILGLYGEAVVPHAYSTGSSDYSLIAIRQPGGLDGWFYSADVSVLRGIVEELRPFAPDASEKHVRDSLMKVMVNLYLEAMFRGLYRNRLEFVVGDNGMFDCKKKEVRQFPPEYAFLDKHPEGFKAKATDGRSGKPGWTRNWMLWCEINDGW